MASRPTYGAIPVGAASSRRSGPMTVAAMRLALSAAALAVVGLTMLALSQPKRPAVLYTAGGLWHGAYDPVTWRGCGPGGDCGAKYHWTLHSFSPIQGHEIEIDATHDHGSYANYYDENGWVEGAAEKYPVTETAPREDMPVIEEDTSEPLPPMEYFAKMFPIEKGYSHWLNHKDGADEEPMTYAEWLAGVKKAKKEEKEEGTEGAEEEGEEQGEEGENGEDAAEEGAEAEEGETEEEGGEAAEGETEGGGGEAAEEGSEEEGAGEEEAAPEEEEAAAAAAEKEAPAERPHGEDHPMVFGDLDPVGGQALRKKKPASSTAAWYSGGIWRKSHGIRR